MRKNQVQTLHIYNLDALASHALADKVSAFHADIIDQRLATTQLTTAEKCAILDQISAQLKATSPLLPRAT